MESQDDSADSEKSDKSRSSKAPTASILSEILTDFHKISNKKKKSFENLSHYSHEQLIGDLSWKDSLPDEFLKEIGSIKQSLMLTHAATESYTSTHKQDTDLSSTNTTHNELRKEFCLYCTVVGPMAGLLTISSSSLTFEPDPRCAEVIEYGIGQFQVYLSTSDIAECAAVMIPNGPFLSHYLGCSSHDQTTDHDDPDAVVPGFFQILTTLKTDRSHPLQNDTIKNIQKHALAHPRYNIFFLDPEKSVSQMLNHSHLDSDEGHKAKSSSDSHDIKKGSHSHDTREPSGEIMLLFRFSDHAVTKQLTQFLLDIIDGRKKNQARSVDEAYFCINRTPSVSTPRDFHESFSIKRNYHLNLSSIPFSCNQILEITLLSPTSQKSIISYLQKEMHTLSLEKSTTSSTGIDRKVHSPVDAADDGIILPGGKSSEDTIPTCKKLDALKQRPDSLPDLDIVELHRSDSNYRPALWKPIIKFRDVHASQGINLMSENVASELCNSVPVYLAAKAFELRFCTHHHGLSYRTFYRQLADAGPAIFLVTDTTNTLFGGFCSVSVQESSRYYGTGETFVFTFSSSDSSQDPSQRKIRVFPWSKKNPYYILTTSQSIAFGGGGSYALTVDSSFLRGSSNICETYRNIPLSSTSDFLIQHFQVWCFTDP